MIKVIIFDFDGVLVESSDLKTRAFALLFADYPEKVEEIVEYHQKNMGISRYVKFKYIYKKILKKEIDLSQEQELGRKFSEIVLTQILGASFVPGALEFLREFHARYQFFIASGTPEEELKYITTYRQIESYFQEIHGTPKKKSDIINDILHRYSCHQDEIVFVGDAESDMLAAKECDINFVARLTSQNSPVLGNCKWKIGDLTELKSIVDHMASNPGGKQQI